jgi:transcription initiation factor IIE alpha subunit
MKFDLFTRKKFKCIKCGEKVQETNRTDATFKDTSRIK